jgi:hypothetical protein
VKSRPKEKYDMSVMWEFGEVQWEGEKGKKRVMGDGGECYQCTFYIYVKIV